jgi:hypothetical protein
MASSSLGGFGVGCEANSSSFADNLSIRAFSTGPKTCVLSRTLFAFRTLALAPFAILKMFSGVLGCTNVLRKIACSLGGGVNRFTETESSQPNYHSASELYTAYGKVGPTATTSTVDKIVARA